MQHLFYSNPRLNFNKVFTPLSDFLLAAIPPPRIWAMLSRKDFVSKNLLRHLAVSCRVASGDSVVTRLAGGVLRGLAGGTDFRGSAGRKSEWRKLSSDIRTEVKLVKTSLVWMGKQSFDVGSTADITNSGVVSGANMAAHDDDDDDDNDAVAAIRPHSNVLEQH